MTISRTGYVGAAREVRPSDEDIEAAARAERVAPRVFREFDANTPGVTLVTGGTVPVEDWDRLRCALYYVAGRLGADGPDEAERWIEAWARGEDATTDRSRPGCDPVRTVGQDEPVEETDEEPIARITDVSIEPVVGYPSPDGSEVIRAELAPGDRVRHPAQLRVGDRLRWTWDADPVLCEVTAIAPETRVRVVGDTVQGYVLGESCERDDIRLVSRVVTDPSTLRPGDVIDAGFRRARCDEPITMTVERHDLAMRMVRGRLRGGGEASVMDRAFARGEVRLVGRPHWLVQQGAVLVDPWEVEP